MADLQQWVQAKCEEELDRLANEILGEMKAACPVRSGQARDSIAIEVVDDHTRFVGSSHPNLFFADQGNNQKYSYFGGRNNVAMPNYKHKGSRALYFEGSWHYMAHTYEGSHFVKEVADRHR